MEELKVFRDEEVQDVRDSVGVGRPVGPPARNRGHRELKKLVSSCEVTFLFGGQYTAEMVIGVVVVGMDTDIYWRESGESFGRVLRTSRAVPS